MSLAQAQNAHSAKIIQETIMDLEAAQTAERAKLDDADLQALHYGQHVRFWERG
jgi:hypothetical protein